MGRGNTAMSTGNERMHPADERILRYLAENPPEYVPLISNRLGMHLDYVERRVETLVEYGLVEAVSGEVIYTTTEEGERYLAESTLAVPADSDD